VENILSYVMKNLSLVLLLLIHTSLTDDWIHFSLEDNSDGDDNSSEEQQSIELNSGLADEKLDLNKCLSVRSQDRLTDCMRQLCNTNCNNKVQSETNKCGWGCKLQADTFVTAKEKYPGTKPNNLLGQALDKCWTGCNDLLYLQSVTEVTSCTTGCNEMRKLQKQKATNEEHLSSKESDESSESNNEPIRRQQSAVSTNEKTESDSDIPVVRTYVLWRNFDTDNVFGDRDYFYNSIMKMMGSVFADIESLDDDDDKDDDDELERRNVGGYKDDREQLSIPTIQESQRWYSPLSQSSEKTAERWMEDAKTEASKIVQQMKRTLQSPQTREILYYILVVTSACMLLTAMMDICQIKKSRPQSNLEEDYYSYSDDGLTKSKLPTYEECMLASEPCKYNLLHVKVHSSSEQLCEVDNKPCK